MDKKQKKAMQRAVKERENAVFENSLPISRVLFEELFDYLTEELEDQGCNHDNSLTKSFLQDSRIENPEAVLTWLRERGGYCDCEILANCEELFD